MLVFNKACNISYSSCRTNEIINEICDLSILADSKTLCGEFFFYSIRVTCEFCSLSILCDGHQVSKVVLAVVIACIIIIDIRRINFIYVRSVFSHKFINSVYV